VPDDLLTIDLAQIYPQLAGLRLRGRLEGNRVVPYPSRATIAREGLPQGRVLAWVDSPIEALFLQIQGSGRVTFDAAADATGNERGNGAAASTSATAAAPAINGASHGAGTATGTTVRLAYGDQNGHPYRAVGRWLVEQGILPVEQVSMQSITAWARANPQRVEELLDYNPSYVFFREQPITDPAIGPNGSLGVPLVAQRSIAVDRDAIPLGSPVFIDTTTPAGGVLRRLVMAQDTGGAIRGVIRADFFWGFGAAAGEQAGLMKQQGRLWVLTPR